MIENTTSRDPLHHLVGSLGDGVGGYITDMEAAGQRQLVNSDRLPTDCRDREAMEALGFVFGEPDADDPMFMPATLPEGWSRKGSNHAMWSHIVDERGIERVGIFYKAAFYDRSANMSLTNVGYSVGRTLIYAEPTDADYAPPPAWDILTDDEKDQCATALRGMLDDAERHPAIYGKYVERTKAAMSERGIALPQSP